MPRALPWARNRPPTSASSSSKPSTKPPSPKTKSKRNPSIPHHNAPKREGPAPDEAIIEYMTPQDDIYIMVEDELLTTAQLYTRSLHRAEYSRLQAAAALKNAHRINDIQRPVDGVTRMSREAIMRGRRGARVAALGLDGGASSSSDEDEEGWGKGVLGRLMSGRDSSSGYAKGRLGERWKRRGGGGGGTRAAAGFTDSQVVGGGATVRGVKVKVEKREDDGDIMAPILRLREKEKEGRNTNSCPKIKQEQDLDKDTSSDDDLDAPVHSFRTPSIPPLSSIPSFANNPNQAKPIKRRDSIPTPSTSFSSTTTATTSTYHTTGTSAPQSRATSFSKIIDLDDDPLFTLPKPLEKSSTYRGKSMAARRRAEGENSRSGIGGGDFGNERDKERERRLFDSLKSF
ncbi:hypothetical protein HOY80DRAFT_1095409 [Tuber brumale]|nr:hypothetical protein HOY80DRAFT_1095409 [Tuber brumale]